MLMTAKSEEPTDAGTDDLLPTRQTLLERLKDWTDDASWRVFFDTYWQLIYRIALKAGLTKSEAEEVVQQTMISVAKAMKDFRYDPARGSFKGWLLQLTVWRITNQFNRRRLGAPVEVAPPPPPAGAEGEDSPAEAQVPAELERIWDAEWEESLLHTALERVRRQANPKHYQIFDLCVIQRKPTKEVREFARGIERRNAWWGRCPESSATKSGSKLHAPNALRRRVP
jgi:RNA polymerase sigma-70 factor (ECF subfamily)